MTVRIPFTSILYLQWIYMIYIIYALSPSISCFPLVVQYNDKFSEAIEDFGVHEKEGALPSKHDLITCLAVGGRWITSQQDLQVIQFNKK